MLAEVEVVATHMHPSCVKMIQQHDYMHYTTHYTTILKHERVKLQRVKLNMQHHSQHAFG